MCLLIEDSEDDAELLVIAVTAQAIRGDRERLLAAGFDGYISKPIDTRSFGPMIESYIGKNAGS